MSAAVVYMANSAIDALIALELPSADPRRVAWEALNDANQTAVARSATRDIDACPYKGRRTEFDQQLQWPRYRNFDGELLDPDPDQDGTELVADLPRDVKRAFVIQCGLRALRAGGLDPSGHIDRQAQRGVASHGGGGVNVSLDLRRARDPWSRLDPDAASLLRQYRRVGGAIV